MYIKNGKLYKQKSNNKKKVTKSVKNYVARKFDAMVEDKRISTALPYAFGSIGSTWNERTLFQVTQGVHNYERVGNRIRVKSIEIKGVISQASAESALDEPFNVIRIVLGHYRGSVLTPLTAGGATLNTPITKHDNTGQTLIKKYMDKYIPLTVVSTEKGGGDGYTPSLKQVKYYKRFKKGKIIEFMDNTTGTYNGMMVLSMLSDSGAIPNVGFVAGYILVTFEDA